MRNNRGRCTLADAPRDEFDNPNAPSSPSDPWSISHPTREHNTPPVHRAILHRMRELIARLSVTPGAIRWAGRALDADGNAIRDEVTVG